MKTPLQIAYPLLKRAPVDSFEIYAEHKEVLKIDSRDQKLESLTQAEDAGLSIRVLKDGRVGFSFTTALDRDSIERAMESAIAIAALMPVDPHARLAQLDKNIAGKHAELDRKGLNVALAKKIDAAKSLEAMTRAADPRVKAVRSAGIGQTRYFQALMDSQGREASFESSLFTASVSCRADQDGESQMGGEFQFASHWDKLDLDFVARESARTATELLGAKAAPTLSCPAVFRGSVVAELLEFLASSFDAEQVKKGRSIFSDGAKGSRLGDRVFSPLLRLVDDGRLPGGLASSPFDGEGIPTQTTDLIREGRLRTFLYDLAHAAAAGVKPTGNAGRGIKSPPSCGTTNLVLSAESAKTPQSFAELTRGIKRGILITDLMGVHTANEITGDFSLGASGILIERGQLTTPVKGFAVSGNILNVLASVDGVADDSRSYGTVWTPSLRVPELSVGGK